MQVNINSNLIVRVGAILVLLALAWKFPGLVLYLFFAFILSLIGKPVANKISSIKIFKHSIPHGVSALFTMLALIMFCCLLLFFFVPMLTREAQVIAGIDYIELSRSLSYLLYSVQDFLYDNKLIEEHETLVGIITIKIKELANLTNFSNVLGGVVSATGSFLMGLFAVFFLTFFIIKDDIRIDGLALLLFGEQHTTRLIAVSEKINQLLSRYFIGLLVEIAAMVSLLYIGMAVLGIKGALLMAFFGGMLNAIPYLGPLIGAICACLFGTIDCLSIDDYHAIIPTILKIAGTFIGANLIDNIVLQPLIYSQSIKAHPVEIFMVIIMGGSLAGIPGMLFAIPVYTIIRVIVVELFNYANTKQNKMI